MKTSVCALFLAFGNLATAQTYSYFTFDVPGSTSTVVNGMNNAGQMVGAYKDGTGTHNFLRSTGGDFTSIEAPGASLGTTTIDAINNLGQIAGTYVGWHRVWVAGAPTYEAWTGRERIQRSTFRMLVPAEDQRGLTTTEMSAGARARSECVGRGWLRTQG